MMKNQMPHSIDIDPTDFHSERNFNQSFNESYELRDIRSNINGKWIERWKALSFFIVILVILCPIVFVLVGTIYRNSCVIQSNLSLFLTIFGVLILVNVFVYTLLGSTFLTLIRRIRSLSVDKGIGVVLATIFSIVIGCLIVVWWILGIIWWIKLTLSLHSEFKRSDTSTLCHPIVYWTALLANIFGLIGFIIQICMAMGNE